MLRWNGVLTSGAGFWEWVFGQEPTYVVLIVSLLLSLECCVGRSSVYMTPPDIATEVFIQAAPASVCARGEDRERWIFVPASTRAKCF